MWILIIIVAVLFLANASRSHGVRVRTTTITYQKLPCGSSGDNFTCGSGIVAGVKEPIISMPPVHCDHIVAHFPVDPLPIAITKPVLPKPIARPILKSIPPACNARLIAGRTRMANNMGRGSPYSCASCGGCFL